jgi:hypothetical protein
VTEVNAGVMTVDPAVSRDGLELLVLREPGSQLWVARRTLPTAPFAAPVPVPGVPSNVRGPFLFDDLTLYLCIADDLAVFTRPTRNAPFAPQRTLTELTVPGKDNCWPTVARDGLEIFFESNRSGRSLIYTSRRRAQTDAFAAPQVVTELDRGGLSEAGDPELSADGRTLIFSFHAVTMGVRGDADLWSATRTCLP